MGAADEMSHRQLLVAVRCGGGALSSELAMQFLFDEYDELLVLVAKGMIDNLESKHLEPKDLVSAVWTKILDGDSLPKGDSDSEFHNWLYSICKNECLTAHRRDKPKRRYQALSTRVDVVPAMDAVDIDLHNFVQKCLNPLQVQVLNLLLDGWPRPEIVEKLGIPAATLHRIIIKIRQQYHRFNLAHT